MGLTLPESMDTLSYFTRRKMGDGRAIAWVQKGECPQCKKGMMEKPKDPKTGKPKIRSTEYVCTNCDNSEAKAEWEATLTANVIYTCPHCTKDGEASVPFKRKNIAGVPTLRIACDHCGGNIDITKKMKEPKKKKK